MSDYPEQELEEPAEPAVDEPDDAGTPGGTDFGEQLYAEPEPEPEPEPEQFTEEIGEKRAKSLDLLKKHNSKRLGEIFGDDAVGLVECPVCTYWNLPGWIPPVELPEDVRATMQHMLGQHAATDYRPDSYSRECDTCGGLGETRSGSKKPGYELVVCIPCGGKGWIAVGPERGGALRAVPNGAAAPAPLAAAPEPVQYAPQPEKTAEVLALEGAGYVVIPPMAPIGGGT
jgi:hypothetical protein